MSDQVEIPNIDDLPDMPEIAEFTPAVKLLTTETPVLGYDGTNINPANWQAKALADRTQWLRDRLLNLSTRLVMSVNGKTGNVVVTYADAGADAAGTADSLMTAHLTTLDPHSQYFDETRGDARYVQRTLANQSNGWLQLDASGKIPASMLTVLASRYVVVANQAARLALVSSANLTICAQADIDQLFYLNGGSNPAVAANWVAGQSATVSGVSSVYGRTGAVTAQNGDYDADKITETATRKFATPAEKTAWNAKQVALVSGTNIRSLFGNSLLGSGNLAPTPAQMGAAAAVHTHTTADITDYTQKTQQLITASLEAGQGVTLGRNPVNGKTIISASGGGSGGGDGYIVVDRLGATAGQNHAFSFSPQSAFNLTAYALKEMSGATNQTYEFEGFNAESEPKYNMTNAVAFDSTVALYIGEIYTLSQDGNFYSADVRADGKNIEIRSYTKDDSIVPLMTSANTPAGQEISQSSTLTAGTAGWRAFNRYTLTTSSAEGWISATEDSAWISVSFAVARAVGEYVITFNSSDPLKSWKFQGSDDGETWVDIDEQTALSVTMNQEIHYSLSSPVSYTHYRIYSTTPGRVRVKKIELFEPRVGVLIRNAGNYYTSQNGAISSVSQPSDANEIDARGFTDSGLILSADIENLLPVNIASGSLHDIRTLYTPKPQIIIPKYIRSALSWAAINKVTLTSSQSGNGIICAAVTRDLVNWHVLSAGIWKSIGTLSVDTMGATKLTSDGMTAATLNSISAAQWSSFFSDNNGIPDFIEFAFAIDISSPEDVATISSLSITVNEASSWMLQTAAQVEIRWRADSVTFRTVTAGNYKLAYQIP